MSTSVTAPVAAGGALPAGPSGTTRTRFAVVLLASVLTSVAASSAVVALTGAEPTGPRSGAVVEQDRGDWTAEQDAVESDAAAEVAELESRRVESICSASSYAYPAVAC